MSLNEHTIIDKYMETEEKGCACGGECSCTGNSESRETNINSEQASCGCGSDCGCNS